MIDQAEALRNLVKKEQKTVRIITVASGKGGVGKSNFVVNLAIELRKKGEKVLIFDADMGMGNDDILMGIYCKENIFDVLKGRDIEEVITRGEYGVKLLSGGSRLESMNRLDENERRLFLNKLTALEEFDFILIDVGAGISKTSLDFIEAAEELIVITTSEPTALTDAYSLLKITNHYNIENRIKVVINRTTNDREGLVTYSKFKTVVNKFLSLNLEYLGCIREDRHVMECVKLQRPINGVYPNSNFAKNIYSICEKLVSNEEAQYREKKGVLSRLFNIFS